MTHSEIGSHNSINNTATGEPVEVAPVTLAQTLDPFEFKAWPTEYKRVTQLFGDNDFVDYRKFGFPGHEGVDIHASHRSKIFAVAAGRVIKVGTERLPRQPDGTGHNYGVRVYIEHAHGYETIYAHLDELRVRPNQMVKAGDLIGLADSTGNSFASHLHLTLKHNKAYFNKQTGVYGPYYAGYRINIVDPNRFLDRLIHAKPLGIDLSKIADSGLNFSLLAGAGVKFAFVRTSQMVDSSLHKDPNYDELVAGLKDQHIFYGNEYYLDAHIDPVKQCQHFIQTGNWECQLPAVLRIESNSEMREETIKLWVETFKQEMPSMPLMIFTRRDNWNKLVSRNSDWVNNLYLWIGHKTTRLDPTLPYHWRSWHFWQFSPASRWPGYYGDEGLGIIRFNGSAEELIRLANQIQTRQTKDLFTEPVHILEIGFVDTPSSLNFPSVGLNFRSAPSLSASIKSVIDHGERVDILLRTADENRLSRQEWYKIRYAGETGYVSVDYIRPDNL